MSTQHTADLPTSGQFRKKPVVISAVQFTQAVRDAYLFDGQPLPDGVGIPCKWLNPGSRTVYSADAYIKTLEGQMLVSLDDWVITGVKGEHYPCKPDIFAATYESAALAQAQPSLTDEREAFEAWAKSRYLDPTRVDPGAWGDRAFKHDFIEAMWTAWKARAALATQAAQPEQPIRDVIAEMKAEQKAVSVLEAEYGLAEQPVQAQGVPQFLVNGTRYKVSWSDAGCYISGLPPELSGRWVAFIATDDNCHLVAAPQQAEPLSDAVKLNSDRYLWLRDEAWAGYNQGRGLPHVFTVDGAGNRRTMLAEEALDDAVDSARGIKGAK